MYAIEEHFDYGLDCSFSRRRRNDLGTFTDRSGVEELIQRMQMYDFTEWVQVEQRVRLRNRENRLYPELLEPWEREIFKYETLAKIDPEPLTNVLYRHSFAYRSYIVIDV